MDNSVGNPQFRLVRKVGEWQIENVDSTHPVFVQGMPLVDRRPLLGPVVIRAGQSVLLFEPDISRLLQPKKEESFGFAGGFYSPLLVRALEDAANSIRHILLTGPTGTGKELAARAIYELMRRRSGVKSFVAHNAAFFANEEEASSNLFGVSEKIFSNVAAREGLIETAEKGVLFLDEVHNLPQRVQRTLLRVMEDGQTSRIGETRTRDANVRFILASNAMDETCGLAHDLFARLRLVRLIPLCERVADIPEIFRQVLRNLAARYRVDDVGIIETLEADHYEALCVDGFVNDNVRGLVDIADRIMTQLAAGGDTASVISDVFSERFARCPVITRFNRMGDTGSTRYAGNRDIIISTFRECHENTSATVRLLKSRGLKCSRRWLAHYLAIWGIKPERGYGRTLERRVDTRKMRRPSAM